MRWKTYTLKVQVTVKKIESRKKIEGVVGWVEGAIKKIEGIRRHSDILCSWIGKINIVKMVFLPQALYSQ